MQLSAKQYQTIKLVTVIVLAVAFSQAFVFKNFFLAGPLLLVGSILLIYFRKHVKDIMIDERDYAIAGKASAFAIQVYCWLAVLSMFLLYSLSDKNPHFYIVASTLAFSTATLMLLSVAVFWYYNRVKLADRKFVFSALILLLFLVLAIISIMSFSK
jgi:uncharacterized membrane protein